jgi:hypothetical protein
MPRGIYSMEKRRGLFQKGCQSPKYWLGKKRPMSEKTKQKISKTEMGKFVSKITRKKISKSNIGKTRNNGSKSHFWKGGIAFEPYSSDWTKTLKRAIRERDNYICQKCSQYGNIVHHIDYNKKNCNPNNLITLCQKCHNKTNFNRNYWIGIFKGRIVIINNN